MPGDRSQVQLTKSNMDKSGKVREVATILLSESEQSKLKYGLLIREDFL